MTPPPRRRGRPAQFTPAAQARYLAARRTGATQAEAAAAAGVTARTVYNTRRSNEEFRALDEEATTAGRLARTPHGEYRYNHLRCRCTICTKAATTARGHRHHAAGRPEPRAPVVPLQPPDQGSPKAFLLARAS